MDISITGMAAIGAATVLLNAWVQYIAAVKVSAKFEAAVSEKLSNLSASVDTLRQDNKREFAEVKRSNARAMQVLDQHTRDIGYLFGIRGISPNVMHTATEHQPDGEIGG